jgi:hypothetical protein
VDKTLLLLFTEKRSAQQVIDKLILAGWRPAARGADEQ